MSSRSSVARGVRRSFRTNTDQQAAVATLWRALAVRSDTPETWPRRRPCVVGSSSLPVRFDDMSIKTMLIRSGRTQPTLSPYKLNFCRNALAALRDTSHSSPPFSQIFKSWLNQVSSRFAASPTCLSKLTRPWPRSPVARLQGPGGRSYSFQERTFPLYKTTPE